jgi:hypothetical protein
MFETINQNETSIIYIIIGVILFFCSFVCLCVFLRYKEIRGGVYKMVIITIISNLYFGLHLILNGTLGLLDKNKTENTFCIFVSFMGVFFSIYWSLQNASIMIVFMIRQFLNTKLLLFFGVLSFLLSIISTSLFYFEEGLGKSFSNTCFITNSIPNSDSPIIILVYFSMLFVLLILSIVFNIWFYCFRDTSQDRNFINSYNNYFFLSSLFSMVPMANLILGFYIKTINMTVLNIITNVLTVISVIYICYFFMNIEYVYLVLAKGPSRWKFLNAIYFICRCYKGIKFSEIKKYLSIKLIDIRDIDDQLNESIIGQILKYSNL